jgi:exodeoxyribonuclease VII large subunit
LFEVERKRLLPYPPATIGLITSRESAAYADFIKILNARWGGVTIRCIDVQVQGEAAPAQISGAIEQFNRSAMPPDVLVLIRGGGSAEDLYAFSTEQVTRAVAASRMPTLVAIGHEVDVSLAELAADRRASTPSNAAELLVPDRTDALRQLGEYSNRLQHTMLGRTQLELQRLQQHDATLTQAVSYAFNNANERLRAARLLLAALNPKNVLQRGYAIVRSAEAGAVLRQVADISSGAIVNVELSDGRFEATVR